MLTAGYRFSFEYPRRLPIAVLGAGERCAQQILPCLRYLPFDLVALSDSDRRRGMAIARQFGVQRFYPDHEALLDKEQISAAIISLPLGTDGACPYPAIASSALSAGVHVWVDAPPARNPTEVTKQLTDGAIRGRSYLMAGYRRPFMPGYEALKGALDGLRVDGYTFHCALPMGVGSADLDAGADVPAMATHLLSVLIDVFGEVKGLHWVWQADKRAIAMLLTHGSGLVGALQLVVRPAGAASREMLTLEAAGCAYTVLDGLTLRRERPAEPVPEGEPPLLQMIEGPDQALGGAGSVRLTGYLGSLRHFADALMAGKPMTRMNILHLLQLATLEETLRTGRERQWASL